MFNTDFVEALSLHCKEALILLQLILVVAIFGIDNLYLLLGLLKFVDFNVLKSAYKLEISHLNKVVLNTSPLTQCLEKHVMSLASRCVANPSSFASHFRSMGPQLFLHKRASAFLL